MQQAHPTELEGRSRKMPDTLIKEVAPKLGVPPELMLGYRLWRVHYLWHRHFERHLKMLGLTRTQYLLLVATYHLISKGEAPSQIRLSNFTLVEKMMVSKTLRVLEKRGYLSRKPTPGDRRSNRLQVTAAGSQILQRAFAISTDAHAKFFQVLGDNRQRIDGLLDELIRSNS
jgi:DNA-binding MarR family transcriptional regulator